MTPLLDYGAAQYVLIVAAGWAGLDDGHCVMLAMALLVAMAWESVLRIRMEDGR